MEEKKRDGLIVFIILVITAAFLIGVIIYAELNKAPTTSNNDDQNGSKDNSTVYLDCMPDGQFIGANGAKQKCSERGCDWVPDVNIEGYPSCQYPNNGSGGYRLKTKISAYQFLLSRNDGPDLFGGQSNQIVVNFTVYNNYSLRVRFSDPDVPRYEVPNEAVNIEMRSTVGLNGPGFDVEFCDDPWGFRVIRKNTKTVLFSTCNLTDLTFSSQFMQLTSRIASQNVYGFGEHTAHRFRRDMNYKRWTMWTRDEGVYNNSWNLYGQQPFYMNLEEDGNAHGVLLLSSNAMDVFFQPSPAITFRTTGGLMDFYFFLGPEPDSVVQQYVSAIGSPIFPPYWSMGFHLCRWGYTGTAQISALLDNMTKYGVPQDTQWTDIDYMYGKYDFTYDHSDAWVNLPSLVQRIHKDNKRYVPILDAGIPAASTYPLEYSSNPINVTYDAYTQGVQLDVFMKNSSKNGYFFAKVWPDPPAHYPDYTHPNATRWMTSQLQNMYQNLTFDGLWIDMNEPSNFNDDNNYENPNAAQCVRNELNWPPYIPPVKDSILASLYGKTACMDNVQNWGIFYNVHSLYGHTMSMVTNSALSAVIQNKRPFLLTRSNYVSTGHHAFHWLGDNQAFWEEMAWSIVGMLEFNLFGIPFVGSDICGFVGNTTEQLCRRWYHLGAFYPFSRNHNINGAIDQDPTAFGEEFANATRDILLERYRLLPYLYTLLYSSHFEATPVARPLFFSFPTDSGTWNIDTQFLWGKGLMFSPVLVENASTVNVYYPNWRFYDYFNRTEESTKGSFVTKTCDRNCIIINTVGGTIIPMQTPSTTTFDSRKNPIQLMTSLDHTFQADGSLFWDDGENIDESAHILLTFSLTYVSDSSNTSNLNFNFKTKNFISNLKLTDIFVLGCRSNVVSVYVNGTNWKSFQFASDSKELQINSLNVNVDNIDAKFVISYVYSS